MSSPTFIVGTGRCGSTMLSNMLREHPHILSLSEFFIQIIDGTPGAFSPEAIDGRRFWELVSHVGPSNSFCMRNGIAFPEWLYPRDDPDARFSWKSGVPALLVTTLPHITNNHDRLFDELQSEILHWPADRPAGHYRRLFDFLAQRFGKRLWVERSGSSFLWGDQVLSMFPDAKFIHVVRDGRDAALSMRGHPGFRMMFILGALGRALGVDPVESTDRSRLESVPYELRSFLPEQFDAEAFHTFHIPAAACGTFWSQQIEAGLVMLSTLPERQLLTLRYEDFLTDPKKRLGRFTSFLGEEFVDEDWSARCAATVRPPRSTWRDLPEDEARALTEACRPGFELLRGAGVDYEV